MYSKHRVGSSWWVALWIYVVTFFLVTVTFFQAANATSGESVKKNSGNKGQKAQNGSETKKDEKMIVTVDTTQGVFKVKLNAEKAPKTVANFRQYVKEGFYDGTIFHRVINGFMIQGGGFTKDLQQKATHDPIDNEADNGLLNKRGTIAMARTPNPNSATAQFFVNLVDNGFLDFKSKSPQGWGYAVFGEVIEGMDVVDKIAALKVGHKKGFDDVPETTVEIKSIKLAE